jgi:hypothetical protein
MSSSAKGMQTTQYVTQYCETHFPTNTQELKPWLGASFTLQHALQEHCMCSAAMQLSIFTVSTWLMVQMQATEPTQHQPASNSATGHLNCPHQDKLT